MIRFDLTSPAAAFPALSPASQLIIQARTFERQASALFAQAQRENACRLAEAATRSNARALDALDKAAALRRRAKRAQS